MNLILLTPEQANQVRGPSSTGEAALEPRETIDGNFILPARVLEDPAHVDHFELLSQLPVADVSEVTFPGGEE